MNSGLLFVSTGKYFLDILLHLIGKIIIISKMQMKTQLLANICNALEFRLAFESAGALNALVKK